MTDEFDRFIERAAPDYNRPPDPPREEMWAVIRDRLPAGPRQEAPDLAVRRAERERRRRVRRAPWAIGIAAAATLAVGFGLGRVSSARGPGAPAPAAAGVTEAAPSRSVTLAAADHLGEAESMLTFYRSATRAEDRASTARWASDLLSTTRMMMDARAGDDPALAMLLGDLELVLVQIVATGGGESEEQELIEESIEQRQLLTKLRTVASGTPQRAM